MSAAAKRRLRRKRRGGRGFSIADKLALTRREIEKLARFVGAAATEDFDRFIIAWIWFQNLRVGDPVWAVVNAADLMGREFTDADAREMLDRAAETRMRRSADSLAKWLGVTFEVRQKLKLTRIGSIDVKRAARAELRRQRKNAARAASRRRAGAKSAAESLSQTKPWELHGRSRATFYRRRRWEDEMRAKIDAESARETNSRTAHLLSAGTKTVSPSVPPVPGVPPLTPFEAVSLSDNCLSSAVSNPVSGCTVFITELVNAQPGIVVPKFPLAIDELTPIVRRLSKRFQIPMLGLGIQQSATSI